MAVGILTVAAGFLGEWPMAARVLVSLVYPPGFVVWLMSGAELFTDHTATAVYTVLDRRATFTRFLRLWVIVVSGNPRCRRSARRLGRRRRHPRSLSRPARRCCGCARRCPHLTMCFSPVSTTQASEADWASSSSQGVSPRT
jgi:hypothetical protein